MLNLKTTLDFKGIAASGTEDIFLFTERPIIFTAYYWYYEATEPNADNTVKISLARAGQADDTFVDIIAATANTIGVGDSMAPRVVKLNFLGNPAGAGGSATVDTTTFAGGSVRIAALSLLRVRYVRAGTTPTEFFHFQLTGQYV